MIDKRVETKDLQEESTDYSALKKENFELKVNVTGMTLISEKAISESIGLKKENFELKVILAAMSIAFMSVVIVGGVLTMNVVADELFPYESSKEMQTDLLTFEEFKAKRGSDE
ncbi:hypothetical protein Q6U52_000857 [Vibrio alginolyticus]|nr:hypothetical protein [Vibrio alginolyticus]